MVGISPLNRTYFDELEYSDKEIKPLWSLANIDDPKLVEEWFDKTVDGLHSYYRDYYQIQRDNLLLYKGIHWLAADRQANRILDRQAIPNTRNPRVVINHLADFTTQWVSRLTRYRPAVAIYPARSQQSDANDAKISKNVLDYIWYENRIDEKLQEFARQMKIFGEAYMWITWNPNKGDIHPDWIQTQKLGQKVPVIDDQGQPVTNTDGDPMFIDKAPRIGDIEYTIEAPWHVMDQPCRSRDHIDWSIRWYLEEVDYLRAKYPQCAKDIHADNDVNEIYTNYRVDVGRLKQQCVVYELYHRSTEFLEKGRFIKRVKGCILENTDLPYEHGQIPYIYMADIDVPDQIRGHSMFQQLFPLQHQVNACASLIYKSLVLYAHPKMVIQDGSCDVQQLLNESTIVSYSGSVPPGLLNQNPVSEALFKWEDYLVQQMEKLSGVFTMSRGEAPSGVRAAKALRVLEEQEDKRAYITATKYNNIGLLDNARMTLSVAGTYYKDDDNRLIQIVGKDNWHEVISFKTANLTKPFHFRIQNTTALSQSSAARVDEISELNAIPFQPGSLVSREQAAYFLDLTADDQFKDVVTRSTRCALSENDDFIAMKPVAPPEPTEDLIVHLQIHAQQFQSREWKELTDPAIKAAAYEHYKITEYLAWEKAYGIIGETGQVMRMPNPQFQALLAMQVPYFPMLLQAPLPPMMMGGMPGAAGGLPPQPGLNGVQGAPVDNGAGLDTGASPAAPPMPPQPPNNPRV